MRVIIIVLGKVRRSFTTLRSTTPPAELDCV